MTETIVTNRPTADPAVTMEAAAREAEGPDAPKRRTEAKLEEALRVVREELTDGERLALAELWELADQWTQGVHGYEPTDKRVTPTVVRLLAATYEATWTDPERHALGEPLGGTVAYEALEIARRRAA